MPRALSLTRDASTLPAPRSRGGVAVRAVRAAPAAAHGAARRAARRAVVGALGILAICAPAVAMARIGVQSRGSGGPTARAAATAPTGAGGTAVTQPQSSRAPSPGAGAHRRASGGTRSRSQRRVAQGVTVTGARCVPAVHCLPGKLHMVSQGGYLHLEGHGLKPGLTVAFPRSPEARISRLSPVARLSRSTSLGLVVRVPTNAHSGSIVVRIDALKHSNAFGPIQVVAHALHPPTPAPQAQAPVPAATVAGTPFALQGMWIWYLSRSDGGSMAAIAAQAKAAGVGTIFVKSSDGPTNFWSQFSPQMIAEAHANGLKVCAWQYVYGNNPVGEAELGAEAVTDGAECLVIDAESQYEGRYAAAQTYIETLRAKIGTAYPLGLASFPYVNDHESFPYSVFLGPNGAQFNVAQMYWKDIGTTVAAVYATTFEQNLIYGRTICPLGQTFEAPTATELVAFRSLAVPYSGCPPSFWDWQETSAAGWAALAAPMETEARVAQPEYTSPLLGEGAKGDQVLWLQEHLASAIPSQEVNGVFNAETQANLQQFQTERGVAGTGQTDPTTWSDVLALPPVTVHWTGTGPSG